MPKKKVTVFGAGVAGLTAAQELVIRGFDVRVIDPAINDFIHAHTLDRGIGGMARSQFVVDTSEDSGEDAILTQLRPASDFLLDVTVSAGEVPKIREQLRALVEELEKIGRIYALRIRLPFDTPPTDIASDERYVALRRALEGVDAEVLSQMIQAEVTQDTRRLGTIWFDTAFPVLPSEHGFRFFPSFYRHLFDTMKRISVLAPRLSEPGVRTAFDNLVAVEALGFAREGKQTSFLLPRRPPTSFEEFRVNLEKILGELEWTTEDLGRFSLKLFEYMTSSTTRREKEYEHLSWSEFVDLPSYSPIMREHIEFGPQMMLSLRGSKSDARTQGNAVVQLLLDQLRAGVHTDCVLNAPTSGAWFDHWHRYLVEQGVTFHRGRVAALVVEDGKVVPTVDGLRSNVDWKADYYVLALPIEPMEALAKKLDPEALERTEARDLKAIARFRAHDDVSPLRDMNGIQFYFDTEVRFWTGHTQYLDSEWGLTSIAQPQFWARRRGPGDDYRSVLSVDIGIWDRKTRPELGARAPDEREGKKSRPAELKKGNRPVTATESPPKDLAREVWAQIEDHHDDAFAASYGRKARFPIPRSFALDQALQFDQEPRNKYPFLVNVVGQFSRRPGALARKAPKAEPHYSVCDGIVLAGTHMKTFTRITSMEGANESARHAVNAILEAAEIASDRCEIWDPEDFELAELTSLRELDERLCKANRPHMAKILDWSELPVAIPDLRRIDFGGGIFR